MTQYVLPYLQQWLLFLGVTVCVGCVAWRAVVARGAARSSTAESLEGLPEIERRVASLGAWTSAFLIAVWVFKLVVQVMNFRDPFVPLWEDVSFLLFQVFSGWVWMAQGVVLLLLTTAFFLGRGRRLAAWGAAGALTLLLVFSLSLTSHAMSADSNRAVAVVVDGVHLLAAGCWIGSLAVILAAGGTTLRERRDDPLFAAQLKSFSPMAIGSVSALILAGVGLSWTHLTAFSDLWVEPYGRVLSGKVALAGTVMFLGLINWRRGLPAMGQMEGQRRIWCVAVWEVGMASGVLLLTAVLTHSVKP